jgi:hypothetical protein
MATRDYGGSIAEGRKVKIERLSWLLSHTAEEQGISPSSRCFDHMCKPEQHDNGERKDTKYNDEGGERLCIAERLADDYGSREIQKTQPAAATAVVDQNSYPFEQRQIRGWLPPALPG